jgi:predicted nucleic acid-binding protein
VARLIVLDASVAIAALAADDAHNDAAGPVSAAIADDAAALKARHRGLSLPDAIALVIAEMTDADAVWTFDRGWRDVHQRVVIP